MMKRTESAWTVENDGITLSMGGQVVATAIAPDGASIEEQRGNAALIAAAPIMLAALRKVANCSTYLPEQGDDLLFALEDLRRIAKDAMPKDEGKSA